MRPCDRFGYLGHVGYRGSAFESRDRVWGSLGVFVRVGAWGLEHHAGAGLILCLANVKKKKKNFKNFDTN